VRSRALWAILLTALGGVGGYLVWAASDDEPAPRRAATPPPVEQSTPPPAADRPAPPARRTRVDHRPDPAPRVPPDPPRIEIPAIRVKAHAIPLGTTPENRLEVPTNWSVVGWWKGGPAPGERGPAVVAGHVDTKTGPAVFYRLRQLAPGDEVRYVRADGSKARFVVVRTQSYSKERFPTAAVYGDTDGRDLRLVTCDGSFDWSRGHYRDNLIVFARGV
jgi:sortase (surface protein transpeptidase)